MRVGVNLLVRNMAEHPEQLTATRWAVQSLLDSDLQRFDWRLQVFDDAGTCGKTKDFFTQLARRDHKRIKVWGSTEHLGIARGRNAANALFAEHWQPDFIVEMHTDHIFPKVWLGPLLAAMSADPELGIVGPMLLTGRKLGWALDHAPIDYATDSYEGARALIDEAAERYRSNGGIRPGLTHPAVKRWAMLEALGGYADDMPGMQNFEDTEEAYRAHCAGWGVGMCPGSVVWHCYTFSRLKTTTSHTGDYHANQRYCAEKHGEGFEQWSGALGVSMDEAYEEARA